MANFSQEQKDRILLALGYGSASGIGAQTNVYLAQSVSDTALAYVESLLAQLVTIDEQLAEANSLSYVTEARGTKLAYFAHIAALKQEGSRLLQTLAVQSSIPVQTDKYMPGASGCQLLYW